MMYRENGFIFIHITDKSYGNPKIARILQRDEHDSWGEYKTLEGTEIGDLIGVVKEFDVDRAMRGDASGVMKSGVREPKGCLKKIKRNSVCEDSKTCLAYDDSKCDFKLRGCPDCFVVGGDLGELEKRVIDAWRKGYMVVRVIF
jgi:hypothetical protein